MNRIILFVFIMIVNSLASDESVDVNKNVIRLFEHINELNQHEDQINIANNYNPETNLELYHYPEKVTEFFNIYNTTLLPRGKPFTIFNKWHRHQVIAIYHFLSNAKNLPTFYKTACWLRQHINEFMFVYAMFVSISHRNDTQTWILPPIYEIYPNYFIDRNVLNDRKNESNVDELYYFMDDVGLNAYYFYTHVQNPFWMKSTNSKRGESYYFLHQQLLASYVQNRLSNDLDGSVDLYGWRFPFKVGYKSNLRYPNGENFPDRPANLRLFYNPYNESLTYDSHDNYYKIQNIEDYETRIREAIDFEYILTQDTKRISIYESENAFELFCNLLERNEESVNPRHFGPLNELVRQVLAFSPLPVSRLTVVPGALEHFETSLRDPAFYQFYKRIVYYFMRYKSNLPVYNQTVLNSPGIRIESVNTDKLITYFEDFVIDVTNSFKSNNRKEVTVKRLNHKPFSIRINVNSDEERKVVIRIFLGPKYDAKGQPIPLDENRINFLELIKFDYILHSGNNIINHNFSHNVQDEITFHELYKHIPENGVSKIKFPERLILPKGKEMGQTFQLFVHISSYLEDLPFGFPLDRPIEDELHFLTSNSKFVDVVIFHE